MSICWEVVVFSENSVAIEPPEAIDQEYDDLLLQVTGNMLEDRKIEIAERIASALNAAVDR